MRGARPGLALLAVLLGMTGCGSLARPQGAANQAPASTASAKAPQPAGKSPSTISRMICTSKAAAEVAQVMGAKAALAPPTWADHLYSCGYRYSEGTMVLSVKELSSWPQTYAYFDRLGRTLDRTTPISGLGQGAFITRDGSVVVRKDWKILLVDISGVRGEVGSPPKPPGELAIYVAQVILGCWEGDLRLGAPKTGKFQAPGRGRQPQPIRAELSATSSNQSVSVSLA
jgi:hypothetical protein